MSKRKRATLGKIPATQPTEAGAEESADDTAVKNDMVHVTPDLLAGTPDIFAGKKKESSEGAAAEPEAGLRSEEHTSDSSHSQNSYARFFLKKKKNIGLGNALDMLVPSHL